MRIYSCNICKETKLDHDEMREHIIRAPHNRTESHWFQHMTVKQQGE